MNYVEYLPYAKRMADTQYRDMLEHVLRKGRMVPSIQGQQCRRISGYTLRYPMANGFPLGTERDHSNTLGGAMGEMIGFIHGARTLDEMMSFGCPKVYWDRWVTEDKCGVFGLPPGDLGDGSYGVQYGKPASEGGSFSQFEALIALAKAMPHSRTLRITNWRTPEILLNADPKKRRTVVAPCHGDIQLNIDTNTGEVELVYLQRSGDLAVGVAGNIVHAAGVGLMFARVLGLKLVEVVHFISDAHIYEEQFEAVEELLGVRPNPFPTVTLTEGITNFFAFRRGDFHLTDYHPAGPRMRIGTPT